MGTSFLLVERKKSRKWEAGFISLATCCEESTPWKRLCCWERLKTGGEGDDRGWGGWMVSSTQWTWVWTSSGKRWKTGKPGVLQSMGSQRVGHDWATEQQHCYSNNIPKQSGLKHPPFNCSSTVYLVIWLASAEQFLLVLPELIHELESSGSLTEAVNRTACVVDIDQGISGLLHGASCLPACQTELLYMILEVF